MGRQALKLGGNTAQFFTRNPRGGRAKELDPEDLAGLQALMAENHFGPLIAHAPYTINPCAANEKTLEFAHMTMADDLRRLEFLPEAYYNFHPGSHVGQGVETGIEKIAATLNAVMYPEQKTTVLLETMAGKGSEVGSRFEELREIIDRTQLQDKIGVCLDTCHVADGGYDIANDLDGVLTEFDKVIGLSRLKALHINDSMNPIGSHKDRHQKLGQGTLGLDTFQRIMQHPVLKGLPKVLETPNELPGYEAEIRLLREFE
jgi:deoxyribonuclease-4